MNIKKAPSSAWGRGVNLVTIEEIIIPGMQNTKGISQFPMV